jgi:hypothetical protein
MGDGDIRRSFGVGFWSWSELADGSSDVATDLGIREQTIYTWRCQDRVDRGLEPGLVGRAR